MLEKEKPPIPLERKVVKEIESPRFMNYELVEKWGDGIPTYREADPAYPEWRATPVIPIDLAREGYGEIFVKNEADPRSNRTKTIKDRAAWELATLYRDYARALYLKLRTGSLTRAELESMPVPRLSLITAGNEGRAVAEAFKPYDLPPPKLILDKSIPSSALEQLKKLHADIYQVDLTRKELTTDEIRKLSNNEKGTCQAI